MDERNFTDGQPIGPIVPRDYYSRLEDSGYEAGVTGKRLEDASLWSAAWNSGPGTNLPAYVIAGWVAGRAIRRVTQETGGD